MHTTSIASHLPRITENPPLILESETRVRFQDCDPFGHLNNAAFFNLLINAREDQLMDNYGWDLYAFSKVMQTGWVVGKHEIVYRKPAMVHEMVRVRSQLIFSGPKNLLVEMAMYDQKDSHLKAILWTTFVHVDLKTGRTVPHEAEIQPFISKVTKPAGHERLNGRVKEIELGMGSTVS